MSWIRTSSFPESSIGGVPGRVLTAWRNGSVTLVVSSEILDEYEKTGKELAADFPGVDIQPLIALVAKESVVVEALTRSAPVCDDPDDDLFIACALASGAEFIVSGDRALLRTSGYKGIKVLSPRRFWEDHLEALNRRKENSSKEGK